MNNPAQFTSDEVVQKAHNFLVARGKLLNKYLPLINTELHIPGEVYDSLIALEFEAKRRGLQTLTHQQVVKYLDQKGVLPGLFKPEYLVHLD